MTTILIVVAVVITVCVIVAGIFFRSVSFDFYSKLIMLVATCYKHITKVKVLDIYIPLLIQGNQNSSGFPFSVEY